MRSFFCFGSPFLSVSRWQHVVAPQIRRGQPTRAARSHVCSTLATKVVVALANLRSGVLYRVESSGTCSLRVSKFIGKEVCLPALIREIYSSRIQISMTKYGRVARVHKSRVANITELHALHSSAPVHRSITVSIV